MSISVIKYNILVIGNGFDLYHGLKTKYIDFVNYSRNTTKDIGTKKIRKILNGNLFINWFKNVAEENQGWIDCEKEIENIILLFKKILYDKQVFTYYNDKYYIERSKTSLLYYEFDMLGVFKEFVSIHAANIYEFNDKYFTRYQGINKLKVTNKLRVELEDLITAFRYYLQNEVQNKNIIKISQQIKDIKPRYVINFNYTNTYKKYGISDSDVCFIHGSVDKGNIVLGIKDADEKDIDFIHFKKYFQRIQKKSDIIDMEKLIDGKHISGDIIQQVYIHFFGHSLSDADGDIIRSICDHNTKIIIYYMDDKNSRDYEQKVINIINVLGKENAIRGMRIGRIDFVAIK